MDWKERHSVGWRSGPFMDFSSFKSGSPVLGHLHPTSGTFKSVHLETGRHFGKRMVAEKVTGADP